MAKPAPLYAIPEGDGIKREWLLVAIAILGPVAGFAITSGGDWFFDWGGADNWQYLLHFLGWTDASDVVQQSSLSDYKSARVPWVAFGWIIYSIFPTLVAQIILTVLTFSAGQVALYAVMRALAGRQIALVVLAVSSAFAGLHSAHGGAQFWNYHAGFANAAMLAGMAAFLEVRRDNWRILSIVTGVGYAIGFGTAFSLLSLGFGMLALLVLGIWRRRDVPWLPAIGVMAASLVVTCALFGILSVATGGDFLFFMKQIEFTNQALGENPWWVPWDKWFPVSRYMGFILGANALALIGLVAWFFLRKRFDHETRIGILLGLVFVVLCTTGQLILDLRGQNILSESYVAYHLVAPGFIAIAAVGTLFIRVLPVRLLVLTIAIVTLAVVIQAALDTDARSFLHNHVMAFMGLPQSMAIPVSLAILVVLAVVITCLLGRFGRLGFLWPLSLVVGLSFESALAQRSAKQYAWAESHCGAAAEQFPLIAQFANWAASLSYNDRLFTAWMSPETPFEWVPGCAAPLPAMLLSEMTFAAKWARLQDVPSTPAITGAIRNSTNRWGVVLIARPEDSARVFSEFAADAVATVPNARVERAVSKLFYADQDRLLEATVVLLDL